MTICTICREEISGGCFVGTIGNGTAHKRCYDIENPPKIRVSFGEVLTNCDDQVVVRALLQELVPNNIKDQVIDRFNQEMAAAHKRRIAL